MPRKASHVSSRKQKLVINKPSFTYYEERKTYLWKGGEKKSVVQSNSYVANINDIRIEEKKKRPNSTRDDFYI